MNDITIDQGATERLMIEDTVAIKAVILVSVDAISEPLIEKEAAFVNGKAIIELLETDTDIAVGDYVYQIRMFDTATEWFNLSKTECTIGDCTLWKFKVCPSIPESEETESEE